MPTQEKEKVEHGTTHSTKEIADFTAKQEKIELFKQQAKAALQLLDLQNQPTKTYTVYSKDSLRGYLKNPLTDTNQKNLRKLSQFLYVLSAQYRRIIAYFATHVDLTAYNVIPNVSMTEDNDDEKILQNYEETLHWIEKMNLQGQIHNILIRCLREDCFFGYIYYEDGDEQDKNSFVIIPLDADYCKISSVNYNGVLNCAFDFSYFDSASNKVYLDYWDKEFTTLYNSYKSDSKQRWAELDPERTVVFKMDYDQLDRIIPPFASLFEDIIDLIDLRGITSVKDQLSIYKLLVAKIGTLSSATTPDDFEVSLDLAVDFYNKINAILPEEIGLALSPMEIEPITFDKDATDESNSISKANKNLWESAGVSQIMDNSKLTGSTAVTAAMRFDALFIQRPLLWQIEARVNMFLDYVLPDNGMRVKYMQVSPYLKDEVIKNVKEMCTLGLPMKTQLASLMGISPLDMNSMLYLENDILKLQDKMVPLQSTYTQTGDGSTSEGGAPEKSDGELTDDGAETKDQEKNKI